MRIALLISLLVLSEYSSRSQIVPSSCSAPDSIVSLYNDDAHVLVMRKFLAQSSTYLDSIQIPQTHVDTVLDAMVAVYNATSLPARDTVVDLYQIHPFDNSMVKYIYVKADTALPWMKQLELDMIPTGNFYIDSLIQEHQLNLLAYNDFGDFTNYHIAGFDSDSLYNMSALGAAFMTEPGVFDSGIDGSIGDGNNITDTIYSDHVELTYSYGWGDCFSGCINRRFWVFRVYFDCSVEFVESFGDQLYSLNVQDEGLDNVIVFPNPTTSTFQILNLNEPSKLEVMDQTGRIILKKENYLNKEIHLNNIPEGTYIVRLSNQSDSKIMRLLKR